MDEKELKAEVQRILDRLPKKFRDRLHNLEIVVQKKASKGQLQAMGLDARADSLYGLYEGTPLPERSSFDPPVLPDKITIFCEPLLRDFTEPEEVRRQIRITVLHEIAHYFGMDEEEIEDLGY